VKQHGSKELGLGEHGIYIIFPFDYVLTTYNYSTIKTKNWPIAEKQETIPIKSKDNSKKNIYSKSVDRDNTYIPISSV